MTATDPKAPDQTQTGRKAVPPPLTAFSIPSGTLPHSTVNPTVVGVSAATISLHSGPLPAAGEFQAYEAAHPGTAAWILAEATKSADHARSMERDGIRIAARDTLLFRMLPFSIVALFLIVFTIVSFASVWVGAIGLGATLTSVVIVYLRSFAAERKVATAGHDEVAAGLRQQIPTHAPSAPRDHGHP